MIAIVLDSKIDENQKIIHNPWPKRQRRAKIETPKIIEQEENKNTARFFSFEINKIFKFLQVKNESTKSNIRQYFNNVTFKTIEQFIFPNIMRYKRYKLENFEYYTDLSYKYNYGSKITYETKSNVSKRFNVKTRKWEPELNYTISREQNKLYTDKEIINNYGNRINFISFEELNTTYKSKLGPQENWKIFGEDDKVVILGDYGICSDIVHQVQEKNIFGEYETVTKHEYIYIIFNYNYLDTINTLIG